MAEIAGPNIDEGTIFGRIINMIRKKNQSEERERFAYKYRDLDFVDFIFYFFEEVYSFYGRKIINVGCGEFFEDGFVFLNE